MAGDIKAKWGTSNQAITITLASLAASATVGRAGTAIDLSALYFLALWIQGIIETGTVSGNKQVLIFGFSSADGGSTYSGKNGANAISGSDAGFTRADPTALPGPYILPCPTSSVIMAFAFDLIQLLGGSAPDHVGIAVFNDTGAAFSGTAGNNKAFYQGQYAQYT